MEWNYRFCDSYADLNYVMKHWDIMDLIGFHVFVISFIIIFVAEF